MIVIGLDVHKQSVTAVAVDEAGRPLDEAVIQVGSDALVGWASAGAADWEIKLLVDHRDDVVDQRRRTQQRLRWHLHQLDPTFEVPLRMLGRSSHLERVSRWLARRDQELQVKLPRELVSTIRSLNRAVAELDQELEHRVSELAPKLLELPGCAALGVTGGRGGPADSSHPFAFACRGCCRARPANQAQPSSFIAQPAFLIFVMCLIFPSSKSMT